MATLFTSQISATVNVGASLWIDLGLIPVGYKIWLGSAQYVSNYKVVTFAPRRNNLGQSAGTTAATGVLATAWASGTKVKSITMDLYKNGTLHTATLVGDGVTHWWLQLTARSSTLQPVSYLFNYTLE